MKKILLLVLTSIILAGCSLDAGRADPDKEKVIFELKKEEDVKDEN